MATTLRGKSLDEWKEIILSDLNNHPMTFRELTLKHDIPKGNAIACPEYHLMLSLVSDMQSKKFNKKEGRLLGTALSNKRKGLFLYRLDQECELTEEQAENNLKSLANSEGFKSLKFIQPQGKERL